MTWWAWMVFGFLLLVTEIATGGFYILFFGLGALAVGLVELFGLHQPAWMQWLMFSIVSVAGTLLLRRRLLERFRPPPDRDMDALAGNTAVALEVLAALGTGKVEMRGSTWTARNLDESPIAVGQPCRVERVEGLVLEVRSTARAASSTR